jgi:Lipid A 3-O-deacylase (PagL)
LERIKTRQPFTFDSFALLIPLGVALAVHGGGCILLWDEVKNRLTSDRRVLLLPTGRKEIRIRQLLTVLMGAALALECLGPAVSGLAQTSPPAAQTLIAAPAKPADSSFWALGRRLTYGFQFAYGLENNIPHDISHVNMIIAEPQVGLVVWDSPHSRLPMDRFEIISEGLVGAAFHPGGNLLGDTLMFRFNFKPVHHTVPFFDAGIAALHTSLDNQAPEISGHTQFFSQGGIGIQHFLRPGRALVFEYRYFHMSNAGLQGPNHGFNGSMLSIGFRWLLRQHHAAR